MRFKRACFMALCIILLSASMADCQAEIIPSNGPGQIGYQAVVLCSSLSVREEKSTKAKAVKSLRFGDTFVVQKVEDGWADVFQSEIEGPIGWVLSDYIVVDPAWYKCEGSTAVYAWNDLSAPKVALLDRGTKLPLIKDMGDWVVVGLRGASGWIPKTAKDMAATTPPVPAIGELSRADLITAKGVYTLTDPNGLNWMIANISIAEPAVPTGCPFNATLILYQKNGQTLIFYPATDGCPYLKNMEGQYYAYGDRNAALRQYGSTSVLADTFFSWFGISVNSLVP